MVRSFLILITAGAMLAGCARDLGGDVYSSSNTVGKVTYGTIVSARTVVIKDNDKLEKNALGGLAGGALGGVAGSSVGGGSGKSLATVGGAILGSVAGAYAQDQLSTQSGIEYIVQLDSPRYNDTVKKEDIRFKNKDSVAQDIQDAMHTAHTESSAISVVQTDQIPMAVGSRVMVVYNDDRPRVVPAR